VFNPLRDRDQTGGRHSAVVVIKLVVAINLAVVVNQVVNIDIAEHGSDAEPVSV